MPSLAQLLGSLAALAAAIALACSLALWLIPQLSLNAAIRGGWIAFMTMAGVRCVMWAQLRRKQRHARTPNPNPNPN